MALTVTSDYVRDDESSTFTVIGLVTDGVTDNRTKIQAVIDACNTAGGGVVLLPGGDIYCSHGSAYNSGWGHTVMNSLIASLEIKSNIHLCGTGTTKIITPSTTPSGSSARMSLLTRSGTSNVTISGIKFNGSAISSDSESDSYGITLVGDNSAGDVRISDCEWSNYRGRIMLARGRDFTSSDASGSLTPSAAKWVSRVSCRGNRIKDSIGNGFGFFGCIDSENDVTFQNDLLKIADSGSAEPIIARGYHNLRVSRQCIRNWGGGITLGANVTANAKNQNVVMADLVWKTCSVEGDPPPYSGVNASVREVDVASFGGGTNTYIDRGLFVGFNMDERGRWGANSKALFFCEQSELLGFHNSVMFEDTTDYTVYNTTDMAVDAVDDTKVSSASFTFNSDHIGSLLNVKSSSPVGWYASGVTGGLNYRIVGVDSGAALLASSPAPAGTTGGDTQMNNGGGPIKSGGYGFLATGVAHSRATTTSDSSATPASAAVQLGAPGQTITDPTRSHLAFNSLDASLSKRHGAVCIFGNYGQSCGGYSPKTAGTARSGITCGNCYILESVTDDDGLRADNSQDNSRMSLFMNTQVINQVSASTRMSNFTHATTTFAGIACNLARNRSTGTNGYYIAGGGNIYVLNNLYSRSGGTLNVTVGGGGVNSNNASFSG